MNETEWRRERDDRTIRYAGRLLAPGRRITITASKSYVERYDGQVALLTAANLLGRMTPCVALDFPDTVLHTHLPWSGNSLHDFILAQMQAADPYGKFEVRQLSPTDYRIHFGKDGHDAVIHGTGWNAYYGPGPSPLPDAVDGNPLGSAFAAIVAISQIFARKLAPPGEPYCANTLDWKDTFTSRDFEIPLDQLGDIWTVGSGSVGSAALYFLVLSGRPFRGRIFDMDRVNIHNLDRSPIFSNSQVGQFKVEATSDFLRAAGLPDIHPETCALHETETWTSRNSGVPDVLISAANELNVRYHIEAQYPPIQLYATTGRHWQSSLIRHIPLVDACSCCLFPDEAPKAAMACASNPVKGNREDGEEQIDAALPFLSFLAGLMTAGEILKLSLPGYPFNSNRVNLTTKQMPRLVASRIPNRDHCICSTRSSTIHRKMLEESRHTELTFLSEIA